VHHQTAHVIASHRLSVMISWLSSIPFQHAVLRLRRLAVSDLGFCESSAVYDPHDLSTFHAIAKMFDRPSVAVGGELPTAF
jgi:hypothetical protein